jgi:amino-acid N-acetyltransferase
MSELQLRIRKATLKDLPQVIGILIKVGMPIDGVANHLKHFFIAENHGDPVGVCGIEVMNHIGLLRSTAVISSFRNQGIGRLLIETSLNYAKGLGLSELYLITPEKKNLFSALGFETISRDRVPHLIRNTQEFSERGSQAECLRIAIEG